MAELTEKKTRVKKVESKTAPKKVEAAVEPKVEKTAPAKKTATSHLEVAVYDVAGKEQKKVELAEELFGAKENPRLLAQYVRVYLANQRQGTASTKGRSEVVGSTKKIFRQKGTGRARHGSIKAPIFVGGGVVGGPKPTDYSLKMNKKQKRQALVAALSAKAKEQSVVVLSQDVVAMKPQTKTVASLLKTLGADRKTVVVFSKNMSNGLGLSVRNLPFVESVSATTLNPYTVLTTKKVVFVEDALETLVKHFSKVSEK